MVARDPCFYTAYKPRVIGQYSLVHMFVRLTWSPSEVICTDWQASMYTCIHITEFQ